MTATDTTITTETDYPAVARSLRPILEAEAQASIAAHTATPAAVAALRDAGMFGLLVPKELGGGGVDLATWTDTLAELSYADGSLGWTALSNSTVVAIAAGWLGDSAIKEVFGRGEIAAAGQTVPRGRCVEQPGGRFLVSGDYSFGSATGHADWIASGAPTEQDDGSGIPGMTIYVVPREKVEFKGNWDVFGLQGNGSFDYSIAEHEVDPDYVFSWFEPAKRGEGIYRIGNMLLGQAAHAGWALGMGRRGLDEALKVSTRPPHRVSIPSAEKEGFLWDIGRLDVSLRAARLMVHDAFGELEARVARGDDQLTFPDYFPAFQAITNATRVALDIARTTFEWNGLQSIRPCVMSRLYCDMSVGALHITQTREVFVNAARVLVAQANPEQPTTKGPTS